jgi:hypothetical protein
LASAVALNRGSETPGKNGANVFVGMAGEELTEIFSCVAIFIELTEQPLNRIRHAGGGAAIADGARDGGEFSDASADAEIVGVNHFAIDFDFLAFEADVGDPVLAAAVGATGDVDAELLLEAGDAIIEYLQNSVPVQATAARAKAEARTGRPLAVSSAATRAARWSGTFTITRFCITVLRTWPSPQRSERLAARRSCSGVMRPLRTLAPT